MGAKGGHKKRKMSAKIGMPSTQKLLTNVAVVRLKKAGLRFELACYPNKVLAWRQGVEKDLDQVLQFEAIYTNVSHGTVAASTDVAKAFGERAHADVVREILKKGDLQVERDTSRARQ